MNITVYSIALRCTVQYCNLQESYGTSATLYLSFDAYGVDGAILKCLWSRFFSPSHSFDVLGVPPEHSNTFDPKKVGDKSYEERLRIASTIAYKSMCRLCRLRSLVVGLCV